MAFGIISLVVNASNFIYQYCVRTCKRLVDINNPHSLGFNFGLLLKHVFDTTREGIYLHTRSYGKVARFRAKAKLRDALVTDVLFADDAGVANNTQRELQSFLSILQGFRDDNKPEEDERSGTELNVGFMEENHWQPTAAIQGCLHERHEGARH